MRATCAGDTGTTVTDKKEGVGEERGERERVPPVHLMEQLVSEKGKGNGRTICRSPRQVFNHNISKLQTAGNLPHKPTCTFSTTVSICPRELQQIRKNQTPFTNTHHSTSPLHLRRILRLRLPPTWLTATSPHTVHLSLILHRPDLPLILSTRAAGDMRSLILDVHEDMVAGEKYPKNKNGERPQRRTHHTSDDRSKGVDETTTSELISASS